MHSYLAFLASIFLTHSDSFLNRKTSGYFDTTKTVFRDWKRMFESIPRLAVVGVSDWITNEGHKAPYLEVLRFLDEFIIG